MQQARGGLGSRKHGISGVCSICGDPNWPDGNHNAEPVNHGRCCDICNTTVVVPARIARIAQSRDPREVVKE